MNSVDKNRHPPNRPCRVERAASAATLRQRPAAGAVSGKKEDMVRTGHPRCHQSAAGRPAARVRLADCSAPSQGCPSRRVRSSTGTPTAAADHRETGETSAGPCCEDTDKYRFLPKSRKCRREESAPCNAKSSRVFCGL